MRCSKAAGDDNKGLQQKDKTNITLLDKYIPYCCAYVYWIYHRWRQNVTHEPLGECVTDVLTAFWRHIILDGRTTTCNIFVLYDKEMTSSARRSSVHVSETDSTDEHRSSVDKTNIKSNPSTVAEHFLSHPINCYTDMQYTRIPLGRLPLRADRASL